jgi:hypothetical protein
MTTLDILLAMLLVASAVLLVASAVLPDDPDQ